MSGRILEKYAGRNGGADLVTDAAESGAIDDFGCFGWLRGIRDRSLSLELRKANGNIVAIPYHAIERFEFDPSEGITLKLGAGSIRVKGRNLNAEMRPTIRLYEGMTRHRVSWVKEADSRSDAAAGGSETVIDAIEW